MTYLTLKSLHLVAMVAWFAAMFYLPRLFVYHSNSPNDEASEMLKTMESRLYRGIMTPSAILTLLLGIWLSYLQWESIHTTTWFWLKMLVVLALFGFHGMCGGMVRRFRADENNRTTTFYRVFNEIPLLLLLIAVFLVVFKPF